MNKYFRIPTSDEARTWLSAVGNLVPLFFTAFVLGASPEVVALTGGFFSVMTMGFLYVFKGGEPRDARPPARINGINPD